MSEPRLASCALQADYWFAVFIIPDKPGQTSWTRKYNKTLSATPADDDADSSDTMVQDEDAKGGWCHWCAATGPVLALM